MKNLLGVRATRGALWSTLSALVVAVLVLGTAGWAESISDNGQDGGGSASSAHGKQKLFWHTQLRPGMAAARKGNKLVMIDFFTDWCGWCKKLDKDTYTDPAVVDMLNAGFVCVKLDAEDGGEGEQFAKEHKVRGFPCIMVLDASGKVVGVSYGYRNPADFQDLIKAMVEQGQSPNN